MEESNKEPVCDVKVYYIKLKGSTVAGAAGGRQVARATPCFHSIDFYVTAQPSLILSLYAPRYCLTASAGFGRQFTKLRALSRLRRRYGSKKVPFSSSSSYIFSANSASAAATA